MKGKKLTDEGVEPYEEKKPKSYVVDENIEVEEIGYTRTEPPNPMDELKDMVDKNYQTHPIEQPQSPPQQQPVQKLPPQPLPPQYQQPPTKKETRKLIRETNTDPEAERHGLRVMKKSTYIAIWVLVGILVLSLIWTNTIFSLKDFGTNITIMDENIINVDTPDINITTPIQNQNNFTIINENNLHIPQDVIDNMTQEIINGVIEGVNITINITNITS